jgi:hypothetical protein
VDVVLAVGMDGHATSNTSGSGSAGASTATGGTSTSSVTSSILTPSSDGAIVQVGFRASFRHIRSVFLDVCGFVCGGIDVEERGIDNWRLDGVQVFVF